MKTKGKVAEQAALGLEVEMPGASARAPISISDLTSAIRDLLEDGLGEVWVAGEISNLRSPASGHLYFTLKDSSATLQAVMFRSEAARKGFSLADGQAVIARGHITVYEARGQYQLQVVELRPRGQGSLQQQFEELKNRLQAEHLFDLSRKRPLPEFPEVVGVVTSLQGAVLHDIVQVLQRRAPGMRIHVRGVRVQGIGAALEIAEAINTFSRERNADLIIVARGGGSLEDLWAFNEEVVARALAACSLPTVSAVGHETDFTIADFVADLRAPTPSAAAEMITRDWGEWREALGVLQARLSRTARQVLDENRRHLARLSSSYALREPLRVVRQFAQRVDDLREQLHTFTRGEIQTHQQMLSHLATRLNVHHPARELVRRRAHLAHLAARIRTLGPQATLDRGYALVLNSTGQPLTQADQTIVGQEIRVVLSRGLLQTKVASVQPEKTLLDALHPSPPEPPAPSDKKTKAKRRPKV